MRWKEVPGQGDMEDRRGQSAGPLGGGGFPIPMGAGGGGLGLIILVVLAALLFGGNILGGGGSSGPLDPGGIDETVPRADPGSQPGIETSGGTKGEAYEFAKFVSQDAQDMWTQIFQQSGKTYTRARVVTFTSGTVSGCGPASSSTGPFYCPIDHRVHLDLSFFRELSRRFGAPGDRGILDPGDVEEGLEAAAAVGDDRVGARSREQWTHGSAELRVQWFRTGFDSGKPSDCDTSDVDI